MKRPASATTFAVLNIGWGVVCLLGHAGGTSLLFAPEADWESDPFRQALAAEHSDKVVMLITVGTIAIVLDVMVLASGVALVTDDNRGRTTALTYCYAKTALTLVGAAVWLFVLLPVVFEVVSRPDYAGGSYLVAAAGGLFVLSTVVTLAYVAALYYVMTRSNVRRYYDAAGTHFSAARG